MLALGVTVPELGLSDLPETLHLGTFPKTKVSWNPLTPRTVIWTAAEALVLDGR